MEEDINQEERESSLVLLILFSKHFIRLPNSILPNCTFTPNLYMCTILLISFYNHFKGVTTYEFII